MKIEEELKALQKTLGKEESAKISDSVAKIITLEKNYNDDIKNKDEEIKGLKKDKETYITANSNLLQQLSVAKEEFVEVVPKEESRETRKRFDMRDAFDERGRFKTRL